MLNNQVLISKAQIKSIRLLHDKKHRLEQGLFIVEGEKMVAELLKDASFKIDSIFSTEDFLTKQSKALKDLASDSIHQISEKELGQISTLQTPNKVLALVQFPKRADIKIQAKKKYILLDNIKDPGNLGTILRTADWFGMDTIFCSPECVESTNPKVVQATMGSFFRVKIYSCSLEALIKQNPSLTVYGAVLEGENLYESTFETGGFLVIGSESHGISEGLKALLTHQIKIPNIGKAESLNASIATAIICSEWTRQIDFRKKIR